MVVRRPGLSWDDPHRWLVNLIPDRLLLGPPQLNIANSSFVPCNIILIGSWQRQKAITVTHAIFVNYCGSDSAEFMVRRDERMISGTL